MLANSILCEALQVSTAELHLLHVAIMVGMMRNDGYAVRSAKLDEQRAGEVDYCKTSKDVPLDECTQVDRLIC
jgi:hypothetical protein